MRGRRVGEKNPNAKLTADGVRYIVICAKRGYTMHSISLAYGVSPSTISLILSGRRWGKVTGIRKRRKNK